MRPALVAPKPAGFVRAGFVDSGVPEPRDEYSAKFPLWHEVLQIAAGADGARVRAYATWRAHQIAQTVQRRGEVSYRR